MDLEDEDLPKPLERNTKRRKPEVTFGNDGSAESWAYIVHKAFRPALDIVFSERVRTDMAPDGTKIKRRFQEWTEGDPPMYAFRETDALSSREVVRGGLSRYIAQVTQAIPDKLDGRAIKPGMIGFRLFEWRARPLSIVITTDPIEEEQDQKTEGYVETGWYSCTQAAFVSFLRTGTLPDKIAEDPKEAMRYRILFARTPYLIGSVDVQNVEPTHPGHGIASFPPSKIEWNIPEDFYAEPEELAELPSSRIVGVIDLESGEYILDFSSRFNLLFKAGNNLANCRLAKRLDEKGLLEVAQALLYVSRTYRHRYHQKNIKKIVNLLESAGFDSTQHSETEFEKLWIGNEADFIEHAQRAAQSSIADSVEHLALKIVQGSGRRQLAPEFSRFFELLFKAKKSDKE